jgi:hypothetical protein
MTPESVDKFGDREGSVSDCEEIIYHDCIIPIIILQ